MPDLSALLANKRWVDCEAPDFPFRVAYRPGATSLLRQAELQETLNQLEATPGHMKEAVLKLSGVLAEMVCDWDLTDNGQPIPITAENIAHLPSVLYNAMNEAITNDGKMSNEEKKASKSNSGVSLPVAANTAVAQNGIPPSEPRATWAR